MKPSQLNAAPAMACGDMMRVWGFNFKIYKKDTFF